MGFIHHTTGAAGATGLMAESTRPPGSISFEHPRLLATDLTGLPTSARCIGGRLLSHADRAAAPDESHPGCGTACPIPATRFHILKGQDH